MRITTRHLNELAESLNQQLEEKGSLLRIEIGGRNGYQAADCYRVDESGKRIGSGIERNIGCGTPREVCNYCKQWFWIELNHVQEQKIKSLESMLTK